MAKKSSKSDRQAVIDEIRKKQKGAERPVSYTHLTLPTIYSV